MNKKPILRLLPLLPLLVSCTGTKVENAPAGQQVTIACARGFSIHRYDNYTDLKVINPWDTTAILHRYILTDRGKPRPEGLPPGDVVEVPVQRIACLSAIDASMIALLGDADKISALAETGYIKQPALRKGLDEGRIADIGPSAALNIERLMLASPDIIVTSPYPDTGYGTLETTGITIVENTGYLENTPLGRAEWIRFIAAFLKKDAEAAALIDGIARRYRSLAAEAEKTALRPTVFSEKKYGQHWYVPGGNSYMAHLYADAAADYLWKDNNSAGSLPLDFEAVYDRAEKADYWIIKTDRNPTYDDLQSEFAPYAHFKAWKDRKIISCNTLQTDYYEEGTINPDLLLKDLIHLLHPETAGEEGFKPKYFQRMKER
jgi:iron complex transport system substrate-binding protein